MMHTPSGKSAFLNDHFFPQKNGRRVKGAPRTYMRMFWSKPATTIMQNSDVISAFINVHPGRPIIESDDDRERIYSDARTLSIYELLILSSLPKNWNIPDWADAYSGVYIADPDNDSSSYRRRYSSFVDKKST